MANTRVGNVGIGVMVAVGLLTGCSGPDPGVGQTTPGLPDDLVLDPTDGGPFVTWIERDKTFAVITWGSSSCPPVPTAVTAEGPDQIAVAFAQSANDPCTANMAPTTHAFEVPTDIVLAPVIIEVSYEYSPEVHTFTLE